MKVSTSFCYGCVYVFYFEMMRYPKFDTKLVKLRIYSYILSTSFSGYSITSNVVHRKTQEPVGTVLTKQNRIIITIVFRQKSTIFSKSYFILRHKNYFTFREWDQFPYVDGPGQNSLLTFRLFDWSMEMECV